MTLAPATTVTRIDPALPSCWEDLDTIRVGFDRAVARVRAPGPAAHRLINALRHGLSSTQLNRVIDASGSERAQLLSVVEALGPALVHSDGDAASGGPRGSGGTDSAGGSNGSRGPGCTSGSGVSPHTGSDQRAGDPEFRIDTVIAWGGRLALPLRDALSLIDRLALRNSTRVDPSRHPELIIHVERFAEPSDRARRWLALGIPHLIVRFSDECASVGPLIGPSGGPCHGCLTLARIAAEPALPVLAAQLLGVRPSSETGPVARMLAVLTEQTVEAWVTGDQLVHEKVRVVPVRSGRPHGDIGVECTSVHPECACVLGMESAREASATGASAPAMR